MLLTACTGGSDGSGTAPDPVPVPVATDTAGADTGDAPERPGEGSDSGEDETSTDAARESGGDTAGDSLVGRAWRLDLSRGDVTSPASIGPVLRPYLQDGLLVQVTGESPFTVRWGWSDGTSFRQDLAAPTVDAEAGDPAAFRTPGEEAPLWALGEIRAEDASISGRISGDGRRLTDATFSVLADTASLGELVGAAEPGAFCGMVASFGERCEPCADGAPTCLRFTFAGLEGVDAPGLELEAVSGAGR
jgi:hypothetical protein